MIISERIYQIMKEKGISQREFSQRTGIAQSTISDWKRKKTNPAADKLLIICEVLGVSPYALLSAEDASADYYMVEKGNDDYYILETFYALGDSQKNRLLGYLEGLTAIMEEEQE